MPKTKNKLTVKAEQLSDRQLEKIHGYQDKIRAQRKVMLTFEQAIAEAEGVLADINKQAEEAKQKLVELQKAELAPLTEEKKELSDAIAVLEGSKADLEEAIKNMHAELNDSATKLVKREEAVEKREKKHEDAKVALGHEREEVAQAKRDNNTKASETTRLIDHYKTVLADTQEASKRLTQKRAEIQTAQAKVDADNAEYARMKKEVETTQKNCEVAEKRLKVAQKERDDLRKDRKAADDRYQAAEDLFTGAKELQQEMKTKELALRNVERQQNRDKAIIRQARAELTRDEANFKRKKAQKGG